MEPAQHPSGTDQFAVPGQRTPPDQPAVVPAQQVEPGPMGTVPAQRTVPGQVAPAPVGPQPSRSRRYLRPILAVLGGVLALLCLGGIGVAYVAYDGATAPDRSAPDVAVDSYLRALFVDRNETAAEPYSCTDPSSLSEIHALQVDLQSRERRFGTTFAVTWGELTKEGQGDSVEVLVELKLSAVVDGFVQSDLQSWRFEVIDQDGWRVCGASRAD